MGCDKIVTVELGQDGLGELLTEFDSPLVEAVDVPDDALDEDLVLVQGKDGNPNSWFVKKYESIGAPGRNEPLLRSSRARSTSGVGSRREPTFPDRIGRHNPSSARAAVSLPAVLTP